MGLRAVWGLRRLGHRPVIYERGPVPNPLGSSVDRSRPIRFAYGGMAGCARMVFDAYAAWEALWRDLGSRRHYVETGMLAITRGAELVVAAGPWAPRLVAGTLGGRVVPSRQVAVYVAPPAAHRQAWRRAPMVLDAIGTEEEPGGFYAVPPVEGEAIKISDHGFSPAGVTATATARRRPRTCARSWTSAATGSVTSDPTASPRPGTASAA